MITTPDATEERPPVLPSSPKSTSIIMIETVSIILITLIGVGSEIVERPSATASDVSPSCAGGVRSRAREPAL